MKKNRKAVTALLVSTVMIIGSAAQAMANNYDAASAVSNGTVLFPNDTVAMTWNDASGAYDPLYLMNSYGETVSETTEYNEGYWISPSNGKAYRLDERIDGETGGFAGYEAVELGSVLTVYGGVTRYIDDSLEAQEQQHYHPQDGMMDSSMQAEKSVYPTGSSIMVIADLYTPDSLQELTSWTADGYCSPDELSQIEKHPETNQAVLFFTTKDQAVTLTPNYTDRTDLVPEEAPAEENFDVPADEVPAEENFEVSAEEAPADMIPDVPADEVPADVILDVPAEEAPADMYYDVPAEEAPADMIYDVPAEEAPADMTYDVPAEGYEDVPAEGAEASIFNNLDESALSLTAQEVYDSQAADFGEVSEALPEEQTYQLVIMGGLTGTADGTQTDTVRARAGDEISVTAVDPGDGSVFKTWTVQTGDGEYVQPEDELMKLFTDPAGIQTTVVIPEQDLTIAAIYEMSTPQTETPQTEAPQTEAPQTEAPQTEAPQTEAPQTEAPQTEAPQTEAPQTEEPQIVPAEEPSTEAAPAPAAVPASYTVTNNAPSAVTVTAGNTANPATIEAGTDVTVTAQDTSTTQKFTGLSVTLEDGSTVGTVNGTTATFKMPEGNIIVNATYLPINTVTVTEGSGSGSYAQGDVVTITADVPEIGWEFKNWTIVSGTAALADTLSETTTFTMGDAPVTVQATYEMIRYTLDVENGNGDGLYVMDTDVSLSADWPAAGKEFDKWILIDSEAELSAPGRFYCTLTMPADDVVVRATYKDGPNPANNAIENIVSGGEYLKGSTITFHVSGAGMGNTNPNPGDYRYKPAGYQIGSVSGGWSDGNYTTSMAINAIGDYTLSVSFVKEVFDGSKWVSDGTTDTKAVTFHVVNALSVQTGDSSPIIPLAIAAVVSLAVIIILLVVIRKRR